VFVRRDDAKRFLKNVCRDAPELVERLWLKPVELDAGSAILPRRGLS
jgi:hypothetical protein